MKTLWLILVNSTILYLSTLIVPEGIQSDSLMTTIWVAIIVAGGNALVFRTVLGMVIVAVPLMISAILGQLGVLFMVFTIETLFLNLADWMLPGFTIGTFWYSMLVILFLTIGNKLFISSDKSSK